VTVVLVVATLAASFALGRAIGSARASAPRVATGSPVHDPAKVAKWRWVRRVDAICVWQLQRYVEALPAASTPALAFADPVELLTKFMETDAGALRLFRRLPVPAEPRSTARRIDTLLARQLAAERALVSAAGRGQRDAFERQLHTVRSLRRRATRLLVHVGATDCRWLAEGGGRKTAPRPASED